MYRNKEVDFNKVRKEFENDNRPLKEKMIKYTADFDIMKNKVEKEFWTFSKDEKNAFWIGMALATVLNWIIIFTIVLLH